MAFPLNYVHHTMTMVMHLMLLFISIAQNETQFIYNGFGGAINLHLDGAANIQNSGLLQMTDENGFQTAHAFFPYPITLKPNSSFSTTFVFAIHPEVTGHSGNGIVFVISPSKSFPGAFPAEYLGRFNYSSYGLHPNHVFSVVLYTGRNVVEGGDLVGIDVGGPTSINIDAALASYFSDRQDMNKSLLLQSGKPIQVWVDYCGVEKLVNVTLAPFKLPKPSKSLLSEHVNLSSVVLESMYVGFSSYTGLLPNSHYLLGWSWSQTGKAQDLDLSKLPSLPRFGNDQRHSPHILNLTFPLLIVLSVLLFSVIVVAAWFKWRRRYEELHEAWEDDYAPHRFSYEDLFVAKKGFRNSELLGTGGFGKVYKGVLPSTHVPIAVKRISHDSKQGMTQFVTEVASLRRLSHKSLVQLVGHCKRKGELLIVYEYMPNGSLDKFLFGNTVKSKLHWSQRFNIIKGVASALLYLHEGWEQVVLHRDVKASNVLLDAEMNARLGDFGLSKLYDHDSNPQTTTHLAGTMGYIAPEAYRTRKPTIFT